MSSDVDPDTSFNRAIGNTSLISPDSPTDAHLTILALLHDTVVEAVRRRQEELPGLVETLQDHVVVTTGGTTRRAYGWFAEDAWRFGDRQVHELFLNADRRHFAPYVSDAEAVLVTLLHEACHVWAKANDVRDTSRDGRYHSRRFAEIALTIGLQIERDAVIGHRTPALSALGRFEYTDLLGELERGLVLAREPKPGPADVDGENEADGQSGDTTVTEKPENETVAKYVFASCRCQDGRRHPVTIRVAKGSWRPGVIRCVECQAPFTESLPDRRQNGRW